MEGGEEDRCEKMEKEQPALAPQERNSISGEDFLCIEGFCCVSMRLEGDTSISFWSFMLRSWITGSGKGGRIWGAGVKTWELVGRVVGWVVGFEVELATGVKV